MSARERGQKTVVIADDHPIFRRGLRDVLEESGGYTIVDEVADGDAALARCRALQPDFALLDVAMPGRNGLDVLSELQQERTSLAVVMLTMYEEYVSRALELGARGYVLKDRAELEVVECLRRIEAGLVFVSRSVAAPREAPDVASLGELTEAERRVLRLLADFRTSREIGAELGISFRTVQNHRARAAEKLELRGANSLLRFAIDHRHRL